MVAAWLTWDLPLVRNRAAVRASTERKGFYFQGEWMPGSKPKPTYVGVIPWHRRLLGDQGYSIIFMPGGVGRTLVREREEIRAAFPEAILEQEATTSW